MSEKKPKTKVDRVKDLINLATSEGVEGANAAKLACALIRQYRFDVVDPDQINGIYKQLSDAKQKLLELEAKAASSNELDDDDTVVYFGGATRTANMQFNNGWTNVTPPTPPKQTYTQAPPPPAAPMPPMTSPRPIIAKMTSRCLFCQKILNKGEEVQWQKAVGTWCPTSDCYLNWKNRGNFNPTANPVFTP